MKKRCLLLGITLILSAILTTYAFAQHETTLGLSVKSQGAGYKAGPGVSLGYLYRPGWYAFGLDGTFSTQKKSNADNGYTYSLGTHGRFYLTDPIYLRAGVAYSGYRSEFEHTTWSKSAWFPNLGIGYDTDSFDASLIYFPKESQTENEVEAWRLSTKIRAWYNWHLTGSATYQSYDQSGKRDNDTLFSFGVAYEF